MANDGRRAIRELWTIDPAHTSVEFAVKHMMFTTVRGRFEIVSGTIEVDPANPDRSSVTVEIDAGSINTGNEKRDEHLRSDDFLDVARHPTITFHSKRVDGAQLKVGARFNVVGDLMIRGKTMEVVLNVTYQGMGADPWGQQRAGFAAQTQVDRRDFGLLWNQALETGGILVANEVKIEIEAQAVRAREAGRTAA